MNKVFNINLGGYPFVIDDDAYEHLSSYLKTIHRHFRDSEGYEEITADIESRMAELFQENSTRPIITYQMVEEAIGIMGTPEAFGAEPMEEATASEESTQHTHTSSKKKGIKTGKRLFRNPDDEVIGGVCSGVAAYLGIEDPLWVRIAFLVITFGMGFGVPLYLILWTIVPKAESASDRLAMRGEKINVSNISKIIEEEIDNLTTKLEDLGGDLKDEFDNKKKSFTATGKTGFGGAHESAQEIKGAVKKGFRVIGQTIKLVLGTILQIWKPILFIIGLVLIIAFAIGWIASIIGLVMGFPFLNYFLPTQSVLGSTIVSANILFVIGIPLVGLILMVMRLFMRAHIKPVWRTSLWVFWFVNVVALFANATFTAREFQHGHEITRQEFNAPTNTNNLIIDFEENPYKESWMQLGNRLSVNGDKLVSRFISLHIDKSETDEYEITQHQYARGASSEKAKALAEKIAYQPNIENGKLLLPAHFIINQNTKWRAQEVKIYIKVPEGKSVTIPETGYDTYERNLTLDYQQAHPPVWGHTWEPETWVMGADGLYNPAYISKVSKEEKANQLTNKDFSNLRIEGPLKIDIEQGNTFAIKIDANRKYRKKIEVVQFGENLDVTFDHRGYIDGKPVKLKVILPTLKSLSLEDTDDTRIKGFQQSNLQLATNTSRGDVKAFIEIDTLNLRSEGRHEVDLRGSGQFLKLDLDRKADLDAEHYEVNVADVTAVNQNNVKLAVKESIKQSISPGSRIKVEGDPVVIAQEH